MWNIHSIIVNCIILNNFKWRQVYDCHTKWINGNEYKYFFFNLNYFYSVSKLTQVYLCVYDFPFLSFLYLPFLFKLFWCFYFYNNFLREYFMLSSTLFLTWYFNFDLLFFFTFTYTNCYYSKTFFVFSL